MGLFCYRYFVPNGTESGLFGLLNHRASWLKYINDSCSGEAVGIAEKLLDKSSSE